jgi:hypothetical protein
MGNIDFSDSLLEVRKKGSLAIFAGPGVAMAPPSNFPNFDLSAHQVAERVLQRDEEEPVDRFLARLADREVGVPKRARKITCR